MFPNDSLTLIVDDTDMMRAVLKTHLVELGFLNIIEAKHGQEAFDVISRQEGLGKPIKLVLADWQMPEMDGFELLTLMRSLEIKTPFVLITTESESRRVVAAVKAGANNYIVKPVTKQVLSEKLAAVWAKCKPTS
jgi:two-component system chemotaxis response regulator CheY